MDQDKTVNKLLFNIKEKHIDITTALKQAYATGYDHRGKELTAHNLKGVIKYDNNGKELGRWDSILKAARINKCNRDVIDDSVNGRTKSTRKGYYFRYADQ